jgi:hypothetical protein
MRKIFGVDMRDAIPFIVCALIYTVLVFGWNLSGIADSEMTAFRASTPVIGELPPQSISKVFVTATLFLVALLYGLWSLAASEHRGTVVQFVGLSALTFVAWMALNYWVIAGFLNSPATLLYGGASILLLIIWGAGLMRFVSRMHDATGIFLTRFGLGLAAFITIVQILAVITSEWRSPTQGIPVLYNLTFNGLVGVFLAGFGGNMFWRERRAQVLAAAGKRR